MKVKSSVAITHTGKVRLQNEDAVSTQKGAYIVCDGMGGHNCGEVASRLAIDTITLSLNKGFILENAIANAHKKILEQAQENSNQSGMGTTVVAAQLYNKGFKVAWCGDSRALIFINDRLKQISSDHSLVQEMVFSKILSPEEAENHPYKNIITRSLGMEEGALEVDSLLIYPKASGIILLISDGVSDFIPASQLQCLLQKNKNIKNISDKLSEDILSTDASDNFSFIIIQFTVSWYSRLINRLLRLKYPRL